mmetsp:Transcript_17504/g.45863  ORF Transcript_17504/g.45863 Transcript_17504/m.45863 type:complete len:282 (-) Transcript_17504:2595-3440(-)
MYVLFPEQASANPFAPVLAQLTYAPSHLDASAVCPPRPLEETPIAWVDTPEALTAMASELQGEQHIAVDLEHHSYRSFQGFTCLMQLSSRTKDYIVDTLALRQQVGPALIGIFANPATVKVLHGADHDVLWLQRDFHLYLVNMFDTGQATRVLSYPSNSLAFLLEQFCDVKADKRFQLADWRARPLSPEMLDYARGDTHYLLYCFDRLKQELVNLGDQVRGAAVVSVYAHVCMCVCVHVCARQESMPSYVPAYTRNPSCYAHVKSNNCYASIGVHVSQMSA